MAETLRIDFDVTLTNGTTERVTVDAFEGVPGGSNYLATDQDKDGRKLAHIGRAAERCATAWALGRLARHGEGTGIASIVRADDWRGCPSAEEALAHNGRTGGDCFGPWLWREHDEATVVVRLVAVCSSGALDIPDDLPRDGQWRPITRAGAFLPWPANGGAA